jgi:hypothetical protein
MSQSAIDYVRKACGRFVLARDTYSVVRGLTDRRQQENPPARTSVEPFDVARAVAGLREESVFLPLRLTGETVAYLNRLALTQPVRSSHPATPRVPFDEVLEYNRARKTPEFLYGSVDAAESDPVALSIVGDPAILETATRYLGYVPRRRRMRLQWSFVLDVPAAVRQSRGQTVFYHYDVDDFNFVYTMFYLTDVDAESGAHVMIPATHRIKPAGWILGRTWRTDEEVFEHYPRSSEMMIAGPAGTGFIQDSSCMHKATAPTARPRLVFQVRYS